MTTKQESVTTPDGVFNTESSPPPTQQNRNKAGGLIAAVAVATLAFGLIGGFVAGKSTAGSSNSLSSQQTGGPGGMSGQNGSMRGSFGTVSAISSDSITVKDQMQDSTKTYTITNDTTVTDDGSTASVSDIEVGDTVMIQTGSASSGSTSDSDSTTATSIQLNPSMQGGPGGQSGNSSTTDSSTN